MKRHDPYKRSQAEQRFDNSRAYGRFEKKKEQSKINPIFTRVPDYGLEVGKK